MFSEFFIGVALPWMILCFLILFIAAHVAAIPQLVRALVKTNPIYILLCIIILSLGLYIRLFFVPDIHRIYYDEDRYLGYSVSFARYGKAVSTELADPETHRIGKPDQAVRSTIPVIHGVILRIFGYSEHNLFTVSRIFSVILIFYTILLGTIFFKSKTVGAIAGIGTAFLPLQVFWSASIALDPYFVFFAVAGLLMTILYSTKTSHVYGILMISSIFLLLCVRLEAFLLLPVYGYAYAGLRRAHREPLLRGIDRFYLTILLFLIIVRGAASITVLGQTWCCAESLPLEAFSFKYIFRNLLPNILYLIRGNEFPYYLSIPAIVILIRRRTLQTNVLALWIGSFFLIYSFYYAGLFFTPEFSGSYGRYFLIMLPPLFFLYGIFIRTMFSSLATRKFRILKTVLLFCYLIFTCSFLIYTFQDYKLFVAKPPAVFDPVDRGPIVVHEFLENTMIKNTPPDALLIHPITSLILLHGKSAVYYAYFLENLDVIKYVHSQLKKGRRAFFINAQDCEILPYRCALITQYFTLKSYPIRGENTHGFELIEVMAR